MPKTLTRTKKKKPTTIARRESKPAKKKTTMRHLFRRRSSEMDNQTVQQQPPQQQRGAGSGAKANETRSRNIVDWPPEPEAHAVTVKKLEAEAEAQEKFNSAVNAVETEMLKAVEEKIAFPQGNPPPSPDELRKEAMDSYKAAIDSKAKESALKGEMDARAKRDKAAAA